MQFYLYSCQDLGVKGDGFIDCIKAGHFYRLEIHDELFDIYPTMSAGIMVINKDILLNQQHNQIIFHKLNESIILCEIKPFVTNENIKQYIIKGGNLKIVEDLNNTYIYFNGNYYGSINQKYYNIKFEKVEKNKQEYGILYILGSKKYIILFNNKEIVLCEQYIDNEILKDCIQIYTHTPNVFNVGGLLKYSFETNEVHLKSVCDRGVERKQLIPDFSIIYFLEALKCNRYKYAYNKLSYELKSIIDINTLKEYFKSFDEYIYLNKPDVYITLKNGRVIGIYHFAISNNLIDNIY